MSFSEVFSEGSSDLLDAALRRHIDMKDNVTVVALGNERTEVLFGRRRGLAFRMLEANVRMSARLVYDEEIVDLLMPEEKESWHFASTREKAEELLLDILRVRAALAVKRDGDWHRAHVVVEIVTQNQRQLRYVELGDDLGDSEDFIDKSRRALLLGLGESALTSLLGNLDESVVWIAFAEASMIDNVQRTLESWTRPKKFFLEKKTRISHSEDEKRRREWFALQGWCTQGDLVLLSKNPALSGLLAVSFDNKSMVVIGSSSSDEQSLKIGHFAAPLGLRLSLSNEGVMVESKNTDDMVFVNDVCLKERRLLKRGDVLLLGYEIVLAYGPSATNWQSAVTAAHEDDNMPCDFATRVAEVNELARIATRDVTYDLKVISDKKFGVTVRCPRCEVDDTWDEPTLRRRLIYMRQVARRQDSEEDDPFVDAPDHQLIGIGFVYLDALSYLMDIQDSIPIVNFQGSVAGYVDICVQATLDDSAFETHLKHLKGQVLQLTIRMLAARKLPTRLSSSVFIRTKWFLQRDYLTTARATCDAFQPHFDETFSLHQLITDDLLAYLADSALELQVWGKRRRPSSPPRHNELLVE